MNTVFITIYTDNYIFQRRAWECHFPYATTLFNIALKEVVIQIQKTADGVSSNEK